MRDAEVVGVRPIPCHQEPTGKPRLHEVEAGAGGRVRGYIWPQVGIEMHLPLPNWNGKFMEVGDGGWGGEMYLFLCRGPVRRGYACIASDMGHEGKTGLGLWAQDNLAARVDWGFRATQIAAARNIYAGPHTSSGVLISTRGVFPGSEMDWAIDPGASAEVSEFFKYILYRPAPGRSWTINDFDFDRDYKRLGLGAEYTDDNPDLRHFKAAGGKLIVAQGGNDGLEIPGAIFDYYETVERAMGGRRATMDFFRLFLVPGMRHCSAGDGAFAVDYLTYLEGWVEKGHPPDMMVGAHVDTRYLLVHGPDKTGSVRDRVWSSAFRLTYPLGPDVPVSFTRPLYPYPAYAKYKGKGDPDDARNFVPVLPPAPSSR
jgi:hypothetical protein